VHVPSVEGAERSDGGVGVSVLDVCMRVCHRLHPECCSLLPHCAHFVLLLAAGVLAFVSEVCELLLMILIPGTVFIVRSYFLG